MQKSVSSLVKIHCVLASWRFKPVPSVAKPFRVFRVVRASTTRLLRSKKSERQRPGSLRPRTLALKAFCMDTAGAQKGSPMGEGGLALILHLS